MTEVGGVVVGDQGDICETAPTVEPQSEELSAPKCVLLRSL